MTRWEYTIAQASTLQLCEDTVYLMNRLGQDGWELASTNVHDETSDNLGEYRVYTLIFKRPVAAEVPQ
jgi:hypothetical protein